MTTAENIVKVNGCGIAIEGERNLLELIRKAGIDIPTFCYHSELSIYGACRLCLVEVDGKGIMAACSTKPEPGMEIRTDTKAIRQMRKINIELLLASHNRECPTCSRSSSCTLQNVARRLGVDTVRYRSATKQLPLDTSSPSLQRDPNKCVLCGDCVRVCAEVQGIGAIDFAFRGSNARVSPAFDQDLSQVECVNCGQCAAVCPTGAIVPKQDRHRVWEEIYNPQKKVVVQIAPAVRVALGEMFQLAPGTNVAGKLVSALRLMGFDEVYDTCFAADMTIFEEATELLDRVGSGGVMPMFTSCCPGWVKYCEIYYPELLPNLSSTRSPQQIFGSVARKTLPARLGIEPADLVVVSIMPCTAKKFEAQLPKFSNHGKPDVDYVLTTTEVAQMIASMGIQFDELEPSAFDMPYGFSTGGGVIFGTTGGVMEAALRFAVEKLENKPLNQVEFKAVRGLDKRKEAAVRVGDGEVKVAVVHGLGNAKALIEDLKAGKVHYDFIEVMACPGGCVCGGGQPVAPNDNVRRQRAAGLYNSDKTNQLQKSQDNYLVDRCYEEVFGGRPGSHDAHENLHTHYQNRSQLFDAKLTVLKGSEPRLLPITVTICTRLQDCPGQALLGLIVKYIRDKHYEDKVEVTAAFSSRSNPDGTICVTVGDQKIDRCAFSRGLTTEDQLRNHVEFDHIRQAIDAGLQ